MVLRSRENLVGAWSFLIGVVLAVATGILSFGSLHPVVLGVLLVLGIIVGFMNVTGKESQSFLMAAVSLVIVSFAGIEGISNIEFLNIGIGSIVSSTLGALLVLLVPATIIVAIKSLFSISHR